LQIDGEPHIVDVAFARCLSTLMLKTGMDTPPTAEWQWLEWCEAAGVYADRLVMRLTPRRYGAEVRYHELYQQWFVGYSVLLSPADRCRCLCHELFEIVAAKDMIAYLEEYAKAPADLPHLVGIRAVEHCCDGGERALPLVTVRAMVRRHL